MCGSRDAANILWSTGGQPTAKGYVAQNVSSVEVEKPHFRTLGQDVLSLVSSPGSSLTR